MKFSNLLIIITLLINTDALSEDVVYVVNNNYTITASPDDVPDPNVSTVTMLRNESFVILKELELPGWDSHTVAVSPDKSRLWITNKAGKRIFVIDAESFRIVDTISLDNGPMGVAFSPDASLAYVTLEETGEIGVFETATLTIVTTISIDGSSPHFVTFNPSGTRAYVVSRSAVGMASKLTAIKTSAHSEIKTLTFDGYLQDAVVSPDGDSLFVTNISTNQVEVIGTSDFELLTSIPTLENPRGIGISPDGNYLFVGQTIPTGGVVSMIRLSDQTVVSWVAATTNPRRLVVTDSGDRVVVVDHNVDEVYAFDVRGENLAQRFFADTTRTELPLLPIGVAFGEYPSPVPDIKVNGKDGPLTLDSADTIQISLNLDSNGRTEFADWWLIGFSPYGPDPLYWTPSTGWTYNALPGHRGRLYNLVDFNSPIIPAREVRELARGRYRLIFGVDVLWDGAVSVPYSYYDFIDLELVR